MSLDDRLRLTLRDHDVLVLPGWRNSGPDHWQTRREALLPEWRRLGQDSWKAEFLLLQGAGPINADSGLGDWEAGRHLLAAWLHRHLQPRIRWVA